MTTPNDPAIPPPPRLGAGCLGVGCLSFLAFFLFLIVVCVGGLFWGIHHVRNRYSSTAPLPIPEVQTTADRETTAASPPVPPPPPLPGSTPVEEEETTDRTSAGAAAGSAQARWKAFQRAAKHHERAHIELSAEDINALIAADRKTRGKAFVRIENNIGRVTMSVPLNDVAFMGGRYLNGEATVQASPDGDPAKVRITDVTIGNQSVPDDFLDRRIFGWNSIRGYVAEWLEDENVGTFRIENNRAIGDTRE